MPKACSIDGCQRPYRCSGYCALHYDRVRATGSPDDPPVQQKTLECSIDGCLNKRVGRGWCKLHYYRWRNQGDVNWQPTVRDDVTYTAAHLRVSTARGNANQRQCVDCGQQADEWSYNHADPNELRCPIGRPYSLDAMNYQPRCRNCHRQLDSGRDTRCAVDGCERKMKAKGLCSKHYQRPAVRLELSQERGA